MLFKKSITLGIVFALCVAAACELLSMRAHYCPPILMYHSVNPRVNPDIPRLIISPRTFEKQMRFLKEHHYRVIPLAEMGALIRDKKPIPAHSICITLDDGFKDTYQFAFPILKKYGLPATVFIIVDEVGRGDRVNWEEIKEMKDSGLISIGSHTMGPDPLTKTKSALELTSQVLGAKKVLESKLQVPVTEFSYPEGRFNATIRQTVIDSGYKVAVATTPGRRYPYDDVFALKRVRIAESASNLLIFWGQASGYYLFFKEDNRK